MFPQFSGLDAAAYYITYPCPVIMPSIIIIISVHNLLVCNHLFLPADDGSHENQMIKKCFHAAKQKSEETI